MSSHHHSAVFLPRSLNIRLNHTVTKKDSTAYWVQEGLFIRNNDSENDLEDDLDMALSNLVRDADFNHYKCPSLRQIILRQIIFDTAGTCDDKNETERGTQKQLDRAKRDRDDANDNIGTSEPKAKKLKVSSVIFDAAGTCDDKNETERGAQKQLDRAKRDRDDANDDVGTSEPKTKKLKVSSDVDNDELMMMQSN